jgi:hypothetical protein
MSDPNGSGQDGSKYTGREMRAYQRYTRILEATCETSADVEYRPACHAQVQDISRGGLRLALPREFQAGTLLTIGISSTTEGFLPPLQVRVVHSSAGPDGRWTHGCAFLRDLSEEELQGLL